MLFIESKMFTKHLYDYLNDQEYYELQKFLIKKPDDGTIIPGTGGFRKLRWHDSSRNKGKRGGIRVIYYYLSLHKRIYLTMIYDKDEADDLSAEAKKAMKKFAIKELTLLTTY